MKAVAYSIRAFEREFLAVANHKRHDITLISNPLNMKTVLYAEGKQAVIVFTTDDVSAKIISKLAAMGVKYILTRSTGMDHIDRGAASAQDIQIANVQSYSPQAIAEHTVALALALNRHLINTDRRSRRFDFRNEELIGFDFSGKTVGLIGLGNTGKAAARIFNGLGCLVIASDPCFPAGAQEAAPVSLDCLLKTADIISLHLPCMPSTKHLINRKTLQLMKTGVMLINTSRGGLIDTDDLLTALKNGKIGYLGLDVHEQDQGLFFEDQEYDETRNSLLEILLQYPNVLITPHQAYLTREALQEIADQTIRNLNIFAVGTE